MRRPPSKVSSLLNSVGLVDEEVRLALERPVREEEELARVAHRHAISAVTVAMYSGACGNGLPSMIALPLASSGSSTVQSPEPHGGSTTSCRPRSRCRVAEAGREQNRSVIRNSPSSVEAHADALVGVDQLYEVAPAADRRQLLILDLVVEDRAVQAHAVAARSDLMPASMEVIVSESATEGGRRSESRPWMVGAGSPRESAVDVDVVVHPVERAEVPLT